ncbi:hypothetical protein Tco_1303352 [Tanacetum coccineum]
MIINLRSVVCSELVSEKLIVSEFEILCRKWIPSLIIEFGFRDRSVMILYVVPTGRVVVPTGRYVVPAGKVIFIVSPSRLNLVPTGRILSPDEHIAVQRESKAKETTLLQSIPDDHDGDFPFRDDARDIWNAVKARISEAEGLHKGYDKMQKILSQLNQLKAKPEDIWGY